MPTNDESPIGFVYSLLFSSCRDLNFYLFFLLSKTGPVCFFPVAVVAFFSITIASAMDCRKNNAFFVRNKFYFDLLYCHIELKIFTAKQLSSIFVGRRFYLYSPESRERRIEKNHRR